MGDRFAGAIGFQVTFGDIGHMFGPIDQYPVPGFVFLRPAESHLPVPFLATLKFGVDIDDYTAIVELEMVYNLSN